MTQRIVWGRFLVELWLGMWLWASAGELSKETGYTVQTVNYHLRKMLNEGTAEYRMVGSGREAVRRWIFTSEKQHGVPPGDHPHDRMGHGGDRHYHHPLVLRADHTHAQWWQSEAGYQRIFNMLHPNIAFREVARRVFSEANEAWLARVNGEVELTQWIPLRRGRVAEAIAVYSDWEHTFFVVFCWVGKQLRRNRLTRKWRRRFADLQCRYGQHVAGERVPQPSAYVVVGEDEHSVRAAMELLPKVGSLGEEAFSFWVAESPCRNLAESGAVIPDADFVCDMFEVPRPGQPENIAQPAGAGEQDDPPAPASLSNVLGYRIASLAEEFSAITQDDCVKLLNEYRGPVSEAFDLLVKDDVLKERESNPEAVDAGLVLANESVYYMNEPLMKYAASRDRITPRTVENREGTYLDADGQRHQQQLVHNRCVMHVKRILHKHGVPFFAGWRWVVHLNDLTQLQPDGIIYVDAPFGPGLYFVEMERTATAKYTIDRKWRTYRALVAAGYEIRVIWITETRKAATRFLQRGADMQVMVTTLDRLRAGPIAGPNTIWRIPSGGHAELKPLGGS